MKVAHSTAWYFPESTGGTEVYLEGLCHYLQEEGVQCVVACPTTEESEWDYSYSGVSVYRYPIGRKHDIRQIRGLDPHPGIEQFQAWLEREQPDIYHQHSWSLGCGLHHLRVAANMGLRCFLTIHTPAPICVRGTMMLFGEEPCDGHVEVGRCGQCWFDARGGPSWARSVVKTIPLGLSSSFAGSSVSSTTSTALAMPALIQSLQQGLAEIFERSEKVIAACEWLKDALLVNGAPPDKVELCRQGVVLPRSTVGASVGDFGPGFQVGYIGRWDAVKGVDLLVEAFQRLPEDLPIQLQVFGPANDENSRALRGRVLANARDPRIHIHRGLSNVQVFEVLKRLDLLAVPSRWLETGPYVVLEAQAMKVPVLGSDLGGIRELAGNDRGGVLVPPQDVEAWAQQLEQLARSPEKMESLRTQIPEPRLMPQVAAEMKEIYSANSSLSQKPPNA